MRAEEREEEGRLEAGPASGMLRVLDALFKAPLVAFGDRSQKKKVNDDRLQHHPGPRESSAASPVSSSPSAASPSSEMSGVKKPRTVRTRASHPQVVMKLTEEVCQITSILFLSGITCSKFVVNLPPLR